MAKSIGNLSILISAGTNGFNASMKGVAGSIGRLRGSVASATASMSAKFLALGGVVGAAFGVSALKQTASNIDEIAKQADRIGFTTEALVGLRHAADLGGSSAEGLGSALEVMSKNLGLAAQGNSKAAKGFEMLGLDAKKVAQLHPEHAIMAISDALAGATDEQTRLAAAQKIFGGEGINLVNVLGQGSAALMASREEAEKLGLTFSRIDAAQVEQANDAMSKFHAVLSGAAQTLVIQLAPAITAGADALVAMATSGEGIGPKIIGAVEWVTIGIAKLWDVVDLGKIAWNGLKIVGVTAIQAMMLPLNLLSSQLINLVKMFSDYLPQGVTDAVASFEAFQEGFNQGLSDQSADAAQNIQDILVGESASEKAKKFFAEIKANSLKISEDIANAAPKAPVIEYGKFMLDAVKETQPGKEIAKQIADNVEDIKIDSKAPKLLLSGSQQALAARQQTLTESLAALFEEQINIASKSHEELKEIKEAVTADLEGDDIY